MNDKISTKHFRVLVDRIRVSKLKMKELSSSRILCKLVLTCSIKSKGNRETRMILKSRAVSSSSSSSSKEDIEFVMDERFMFQLEPGYVPKQLLAEFRSVPKLKQNSKGLKLGVCDFVALDLKNMSVGANQDLKIVSHDDCIFGTAHITSWQSELRRTEGCKKKFPSRVFLRDHKCENRLKLDESSLSKKKKKRKKGHRFLFS